MKVNPPKWADRLLQLFCDPDLLEEIQGDLYELYYHRSLHHSPVHADARFIWEVLRLFRLPLVRNPFVNTGKLTVGNGNTVGLGTWNDMVFEARNKDYGAYKIRNSYGQNMLFGFLVVASVWSVVVLWWWINLNPDSANP